MLNDRQGKLGSPWTVERFRTTEPTWSLLPVWGRVRENGTWGGYTASWGNVGIVLGPGCRAGGETHGTGAAGSQSPACLATVTKGIPRLTPSGIELASIPYNLLVPPL